jgi:TolB protein
VEKTISSTKWSSSGRATWLADGSGLVLDASDQSSSLLPQLWYVAYPSGEARRITNDLNRYYGVSLTGDSSALVTVQGEVSSSIWVAPQGNATVARRITSGSGTGEGLYGVASLPNGGVLYTSITSGHSDIWSTSADGSNPAQLTVNAGNNGDPAVSADGRTVVFSSDRDGHRNIWRMNIDGSSPKQLTNGDADFTPHITPDGKWLIYQSDRAGKLRIWKQPLDGGTPQPLMDNRNGVSNLMSLPLDGHPPKQVTNFTEGTIFKFAWSADGKQLFLARGSVNSDVVLISNVK